MTPNKETDAPLNDVSGEKLTAGIDHEFDIYYNAEPANYEYAKVKLTITLSKAIVYLNGSATIVSKNDNQSTSRTESDRVYDGIDYNSKGYIITPSVSCDTITGTIVVDNLIGAKLTYSGVGVTDGNTFKDGGTYTVTVSVNDTNYTFFVEDDTHPMDESKPKTFTVKINSVYVEYVLVHDYTYATDWWGLVTSNDTVTKSERATALLNIDDVLKFSNDYLALPIYDTLESDAITSAKQAQSKYKSGKSTKKLTVIVAEDTRLNNDASVNSNVTLLVPYSSALDTTEMPTVTSTQGINDEYVRLTLSEKQALSVYGTLNVSARQCSPVGNYSGFITGSYGLMALENNSDVLIESGAKLISFGYITGQGNVYLKNGSVGYEAFDIKDWAGGTLSSAVYNNFFPFTQYLISNIESKLHVYKGSTLYARYYLVAGGIDVKDNIAMFGDSGLFEITSDGKTNDKKDCAGIVKEIDNGKVVITTYGTIQTNNISVTIQLSDIAIIGGLSKIKIKTEGKEIPISGYYSIIVEEKSTVNINSKFKLLPGASLLVKGSCVIAASSSAGLIGYTTEFAGAFITTENADGASRYYGGDITKAYTRFEANSYESNSQVIMQVDGSITVNAKGVLGGYLTTGSVNSIIELSESATVSGKIISYYNTKNGTDTDGYKEYEYLLTTTGESGNTTLSAGKTYYGQTDGSFK